MNTTSCFLLFRSRPIVNTSATLSVYPTIINPEEKLCTINQGTETQHVSWYVFHFSLCNTKFVTKLSDRNKYTAHLFSFQSFTMRKMKD